MATTTAAPEAPAHTGEQFTPWPEPDANGIINLQLGAYHSHQLIEHAVRNDGPTETTAQARIRHSFLGDYLAATPETGSLEGAHAFLHGCMVDLDRYFFCGALTRARGDGGDEPPLVTLRLEECPPYSSFGVTGSSARGLARRQIIHMYRSQRGPADGGRHPRAALLQTLLREMVHAYLQLFFCRCAADPAGAGALDAHEGRGALFRYVLRRAAAALRRWQLRAVADGNLPRALCDPHLGVVRPALGGRRTRAHRVEDWYLSQAAWALPRLRREWAWFEPRAGRPVSLEGVLVRLRCPRYIDYVRLRVMPWRRAMGMAAAAFRALVCLVVLLAWWRVRG
ncbi:hypothetical protein F4809DRAFT_656698 [Biscogniauxia mediterranea]|nr:hypothetical protein F4809DRAFT_656698 [Biscogniauxia mediterranea]